MQRYHLAGCAVFLLLAFSSLGRSDDTILGPIGFAEDPRLRHLITMLSDPDPGTRATSVQELIAIGEPARPVLRRSLATAGAQTRAEIDHVLLHVPWIQHGDNEAVEQAFTGYAEMDAEQRCEHIDTLWLYSGSPPPASSLMRIIMNDPCTAVRWEAAAVLFNKLDDNKSIEQDLIALVEGLKPAPQAYLPADEPYIQPGENAPLLALAGWAYRLDDVDRCAELLEKSLSMEEEHPSAFRGQMDFVFKWLADHAYAHHQNKRMIQLIREEASRTQWKKEFVPPAISDLFAKQADFGPDPGFADDLRCYQNYFTHPEMIYTLSRMASRNAHPVLGELIGDIALAMSGLDADSHFQVGEFLTQHRWNAAAERELKFSLHLPGGDQSSPDWDNRRLVDTYLRLSHLADERTDDLAAAKYMEQGLKKNTDSSGLVRIDAYGKTVPWPSDQAWAEVNLHYLRAAQQAHDLANIKEYLEKLLGTDDGEKMLAAFPSMAADIVPALQTVGRNKLADSIFDSAYTALEKEVTAQPQDPMPKNNLAWLCACASKRLEDAAKLAAQAVALAPDDGACLDTQAEVYMRLGQPAKAAELEKRALEAKPEDVYMAKQLKRFQAAAKQAN